VYDFAVKKYLTAKYNKGNHKGVQGR